jgi:hypothetical protein
MAQFLALMEKRINFTASDDKTAKIWMFVTAHG